MPSGNLRPIAALSAEVDATEWAGTEVFARGASAVTLPAGATVYDDVLALLHGYGSQTPRKLATDLAAAWTGSGTVTCGIDANDLFYIESDTTDFTIGARASNVLWGFDAGGHGLVGGSAPFRRTAANNWTRGVFQVIKSTSSLLLDPAGAGASFDLPTYSFTAQSLPTMVRGAEGDADDGVALSLETADNAGCDSTNDRIRWGVNANGYVYYTRPSSVATGITWTSTSFRDRLGFTGMEVEVIASSVATCTATLPCPGFLVPPWPLESCERTYREETRTVQLTSGLIARNEVARFLGWAVAVKLGGPASARDQSRHAIDRFLRWCPLGAKVRLFREWGDPRRAREPWEATYPSDYAYTHAYTPERNGLIGSRRCRRAAGDAAERSLSYGSRVQVLGDFAIQLQDAE